MTPSEAANIYTQEIRRIYAEAERSLFEKIAKRIAQGMDLDTATWEAQREADVTGLMREARKVVQQVRDQDPAVKDAVTQAYDAGIEAASLSLAAEHLAAIASPAPYKTGHALEQLTKLALDSTHATHLRMLRSTRDVYRAVISEAAQQVKAGATDAASAAQVALNKFADKGITGFVDKAGRNWNLQSYIDMALRTTCGQASVEGHIDQLQANGHDLVIVSSSGSVCETCAPWEGRVLSLSGQSDQYPSLSDATSEGHLMGPNCTHSLGIYLEGVTRVEKAPYDPEAYAAEQKQRSYERGIRQWKQREAVAITPSAKTEAHGKVREWQAKQRDWIANSGHDLRRDYPREQVRVGKVSIGQ